ncbi:hypothetical protein ENBRE01_1626 [Enteropsectra breve]|nr:hypothetical protein ENBRE01_1626 [Enteropsectra breve]
MTVSDEMNNNAPEKNTENKGVAENIVDTTAAVANTEAPEEQKSFFGKMKEKYTKIFKDAPSFAEFTKLRGSAIILPEMSFYEIMKKNLYDFEVMWFLVMLAIDVSVLFLWFCMFGAKALGSFFCFIAITIFNFVAIGNFQIGSYKTRLFVLNAIGAVIQFLVCTGISGNEDGDDDEDDFHVRNFVPYLHLIYILVQTFHACIISPRAAPIEI